MSKRAFGNKYYSLEETSDSKAEIMRFAKKHRASGKYLVRVALTGWAKGGHKYGVWIADKK